MSLTLNKERLAAIYDCLRSFPPFCKLKIPPASEIEFKLNKSSKQYGHYCRYARSDHHWISISSVTCGHFSNVAMFMAHEMIHLHQGIAKTETSGVNHNVEFRKIASQVCHQFGWDFKLFV